MAVKPGADTLKVLEQIVEDPVTGLTLQFSVVPGAKTPFRLRIFGALLTGSREIRFDANGKKAGSETALLDVHRPTWIREVQ